MAQLTAIRTSDLGWGPPGSGRSNSNTVCGRRARLTDEQQVFVNFPPMYPSKIGQTIPVQYLSMVLELLVVNHLFEAGWEEIFKTNAK